MKARTGKKQAGEKSPTTLANMVYRQLRNDIISGRLAPGTRLVRRALATRFNTSVIPVLEALVRLENDGLAEYAEKVGTTVAAITADQLETQRVLREGTEIHMARLFAQYATRSGREEILRRGREVDDYHRRLPIADFEELRKAYRAHYDFHRQIPALAGYPGVAAELGSIWYKRLMLFSNINMADTPATEPHNHGWLAEGLASGDPDVAVERMRMHLGYNKEHYRHALNHFLANKDETWRIELFLLDEE